MLNIIFSFVSGGSRGSPKCMYLHSSSVKKNGKRMIVYLFRNMWHDLFRNLDGNSIWNKNVSDEIFITCWIQFFYRNLKVVLFCASSLYFISRVIINGARSYSYFHKYHWNLTKLNYRIKYHLNCLLRKYYYFTRLSLLVFCKLIVSVVINSQISNLSVK